MCIQGSALGVECSGYHLEVPNNFIFDFAFCESTKEEQRDVPQAFGVFAQTLRVSC